MTLTIKPLAAFIDNYIWVITRSDSNIVAVVDPGDASVVLSWLRKKNKQLAVILITHKHHDHIGGVERLVKETAAKVYAPVDLPYVHADKRFSDNETFTLFAARWHVFAIPGHTLEHVMYYCAAHDIAFVGDTVFAAGCGRMFEGSAQQMHNSLRTIMALPRHTLLYAAHEYTLANIQFALQHEPNNVQLQRRQREAQRLRAQNMPTLPTCVEHELATNPFCRATQLRAHVEKLTGQRITEDWQVFAYLRKAKDIA